MSVRQTDRAFGLTFAVVFVIIGAIIWWVTEAVAYWPFVVAAIFAALALFAAGILLPLNRFWTLIGGKFGAINNNLVLGVFYILFMIPFGLIFRLFGRDPLVRKIDEKQDSYWQVPNRQLDRDTLRDMY